MNATTTRTRFGVGLYTGQRAGGANYRNAVPLAVAAEPAGFDSFWVTEHHGLPDGYLPSPLTLLAALPPATSRIELGTGVLLAPLHHPLRIAEDAAVVDQLSGGRLILGRGIGYADHEYRSVGVAPATRGARLAALVGALRLAWTGEPFSCQEFELEDVPLCATGRPNALVRTGSKSSISVAYRDTWRPVRCAQGEPTETSACHRHPAPHLTDAPVLEDDD